MPRTIVIRIVVDNRDALNAIKAQREAQKQLNDQTRFNNDEQRKAEIQALRVAQANKALIGSQKSLVASIAEGYVVGKAVSAVYTSIANSIGYLITQNAQLELSLAKVKAVTGGTDADIDSLKSTIFALGRTTATSITGIAEAALELSKLGFAGKELEVALAGVARLSSILGDSLETTGNLVGGVIQTFDLSADEAAKVADKLFLATGRSATNIEGFRIAFALAGNVAHDAGITFDELSTAIAVLSNQGIRASTIGTGLRNFIVELSKEGSKAQLALGGSIEGLGLVGAMSRLADLKLKPGSLVEIFGKPGAPVASGLGKAGEEYQKMIDIISNGNGALDTAKDKINDTFIGSITLFKNSLVELSNALGSGVGPIIVDILHGVTDEIHSMTDAVTKFNEVLKILKGGDDQLEKQFHLGETTVSGGKIRGPNIDDLKRQLGKFAQADAADIRNTEDVFNELFGKPKTDKAKGVDPAAGAIAAAKAEAEAKRIENVAKELRKSFQSIKDEVDFQSLFNINLSNQELDKLSQDLFKIAKGFSAIGKEKDALEVFKEFQKFKRERGDTFEEDRPETLITPDANFPGSFEKSVSEIANPKKTKQDDFKEFLKATSDELDGFNQQIELTKSLMDALGESTNLFGDYLVNAFLDHEDAFSDFQDAFGDLAKAFVSQLIAMELKLLAFKALMGIFGAVGGLFSPATAPIGITDLPIFAANGFDGIVDKPQAFIAGEAGRERVTVTPLGKGSSGSGGQGSVTNIYVSGDVFNADKLVDKVALTNERTKTRYV